MWKAETPFVPDNRKGSAMNRLPLAHCVVTLFYCDVCAETARNNAARRHWRLERLRLTAFHKTDVTHD
jgi:hypothetical protein